MSHAHTHDRGYSHGLVVRSIVRSRNGVRTASTSLVVLLATALVQVAVYALSGSVALLADLVHNFGDALTAVPLGIAFFLRSERGERLAGLAVVAAIFVSARFAGVEAVMRLWALAAAGLVGLAITLVVLRITWHAWRTIRG